MNKLAKTYAFFELLSLFFILFTHNLWAIPYKKLFVRFCNMIYQGWVVMKSTKMFSPFFPENKNKKQNSAEKVRLLVYFYSIFNFSKYDGHKFLKILQHENFAVSKPKTNKRKIKFHEKLYACQKKLACIV